jgi:hypothetical protein
MMGRFIYGAAAGFVVLFVSSLQCCSMHIYSKMDEISIEQRKRMKARE